MRTSQLKHCCLPWAHKGSAIASLDFGVKNVLESKSQKLVLIVKNNITMTNIME